MSVGKPTAESSSAEQPRKKGKPRGKPWPKGTSGNPGGVPKEAKELRASLQLHGDELVRKLMEQVRDDNTLCLLRALEYVLGKPATDLTLNGGDTPIQVIVQKFGDEVTDA